MRHSLSRLESAMLNTPRFDVHNFIPKETEMANPIRWDQIPAMSVRDEHIEAARKTCALGTGNIVVHSDGQIVVNAQRSSVATLFCEVLADYGVQHGVVGHMVYIKPEA